MIPGLVVQGSNCRDVCRHWIRGAVGMYLFGQARVVHSICVVINKHCKILQCLQGVLKSLVATPDPVVGPWADNRGNQSY